MTQNTNRPARPRTSEQGNILFMILLAVVLIGLLTAAIQSTNHSDGSNIDKETLSIRASEVRQYAAELERSVHFITESGKSESDVRFAHPEADASYGDLVADADKTDQVFSPDGGAASYKKPPAGINDASPWEFYAGTQIPGIGTAAADLVAVLPNVTQDFCNAVNTMNGQTGTPADTGGATASGANPGNCVALGAAGRFNDTQQFYTTVNTMDETTFAQDPNTSAARPAPQACVRCTVGGANHFYHVLLAR